jgi:hypothetical protein
MSLYPASRCFCDTNAIFSRFGCLYRCQTCVFKFFDGFVRLLGPLLVVSATILIGGIVFAYFFYIVPLVFKPHTLSVRVCFVRT